MWALKAHSHDYHLLIIFIVNFNFFMEKELKYIMDTQTVVSTLGQNILDNLMVPLILLFAGAVIAIIKPRVDKMVDSITARADMDELMEENTVRKELLELIDKQVQAAVASNMSIAIMIKKRNGGTMPEEDGKRLAENARELVMNSLPLSLTKEGEKLNSIIGGTNRLEAVIKNSLEKHVYEYKYRGDNPKLSLDDAPKQKENSNNGSLLDMMKPKS